MSIIAVRNGTQIILCYFLKIQAQKELALVYPKKLEMQCAETL